MWKIRSMSFFCGQLSGFEEKLQETVAEHKIPVAQIISVVPCPDLGNHQWMIVWKEHHEVPEQLSVRQQCLIARTLCWLDQHS